MKKWYKEYFKPVSDKIIIECLTWEEVIEFIRVNDAEAGKNLSAFYEKCLKFSRKSPNLKT